MDKKPTSVQLMDIPPKTPIPGGKARFIHSAQMTMAYWEFDRDADLPEHSHPHEQISHLLDGEFELTIDNVVHPMTKGSVVVIPSNAIHSGRALSQCTVIDFFHPVREDFK